MGIVVAERNAETGARTASELRDQGSEAIAVTTDVRDSSQVRAAFQAALREFGQVDVLVNNAGGMFATSVLETTDDGWNALLRVNLTSVFLCSREAAAIMTARGTKGRIINIASISGVGAAERHAGYGAAKAAIIHFTKTCAVEWARSGIRVNAVTPGLILSDWVRANMTPKRLDSQAKRIPLGRAGEVDEIARVVLFLASDLSSYVTGQTIAVDGGITALPSLQGPPPGSEEEL